MYMSHPFFDPENPKAALLDKEFKIVDLIGEGRYAQ